MSKVAVPRRDKFAKALHSKLFAMKIIRTKKGKGSYDRSKNKVNAA